MTRVFAGAIPAVQGRGEASVEDYKVGDRIEHSQAPGFMMPVLDIRDCEVDSARPVPHLAYSIVDPDGQEDWLCGYDVRRVG